MACAPTATKASGSTTADLIRGEGGIADVVVGDVASEADCHAIVGVRRVVGSGVQRRHRTGHGPRRASADDWDTTLTVNLRSHFLLAKEALPLVPEGGAIVFIGSVAGLQPGSRLPAYDASKAGLVGLCRHVALEGARRGVRANLVAPGLIDTPLGRNTSRGRPSRELTPVPLGRQGTAWEVAPQWASCSPTPRATSPARCSPSTAASH